MLYTEAFVENKRNYLIHAVKCKTKDILNVNYQTNTSLSQFTNTEQLKWINSPTAKHKIFVSSKT